MPPEPQLYWPFPSIRSSSHSPSYTCPVCVSGLTCKPYGKQRIPYYLPLLKHDDLPCRLTQSTEKLGLDVNPEPKPLFCRLQGQGADASRTPTVLALSLHPVLEPLAFTDVPCLRFGFACTSLLRHTDHSENSQTENCTVRYISRFQNNHFAEL